MGKRKKFPPRDSAGLPDISTRLREARTATESLNLLEEDARIRLRTLISPGITLPVVDLDNPLEAVSAIESIHELCAKGVAESASELSDTLRQDIVDAQRIEETTRVVRDRAYANLLILQVKAVVYARVAMQAGDQERAAHLALRAAFLFHEHGPRLLDSLSDETAALSGARGAQRRSEKALERRTLFYAEYVLLKNKGWKDRRIYQHLANAAQARGEKITAEGVRSAIRTRIREIEAGAPK
jgi:hypothetical protein